MSRFLTFIASCLVLASPVLAQPATSKPPAEAKKPVAASRPAMAMKVPPANVMDPPKMPPAVNPITTKNWTCPGTVYDFGKVWQNANVTYNFEIKNTSDKVIEIVDAKTECHCTVPGQFERIIQPGKSGFVPFTLHTAGLGKQLVKHCYITLNDPVQPSLSCELHGFVQTLFELVPNDLGNFAEITDPMSKVVREGEVKSNIAEPFTFEYLEPKDKRPFKVELTETEKGKKWHIKVSAVPPLPSGPLTYFYMFKTSDPHLPMWNLVVSAYRPESIAAKPPNVYMPNVVTTTDPISVDVMNYTGKPFKVTSAVVNDAPELTTTIEPDGMNYKVKVHAPMGYRVPQSRHLIIKTDNPGVPQIDVTLYTIYDKPNLPPIQHNKVAASRGAIDPRDQRPAGQMIKRRGGRKGGLKGAGAAASQPAGMKQPQPQNP